MSGRAARREAGRDLRGAIPRSAHGAWSPAPDRPDPVTVLEAQAASRVPELVPIRHGRMVASPFAFLRGAAAVMAADLAGTPVTGIRVQACGDAHLSNFGVFASPERGLVFDVNDFDETLPAPWEWDLKRLAASLAVCSRVGGAPDAAGRRAARTAIEGYRVAMDGFAELSTLDLWYQRLDVDALVGELSGATRKRVAKEAARARRRTGESVVPKLTEVVDGRRRIRDDPPLLRHIPGDWIEAVPELYRTYRRSLEESRRALLGRYELNDVALKVVGVGSVGTRAGVVLLDAGGEDPLFLQAKEAQASVLAPYAGRSRHRNQGERVVVGQRLMQAASDILLGWTRIAAVGVDFYFRQLRDMKLSIDVEALPPSALGDYARACGWTLARAHARSSGRAPEIAGYLGRSEGFDVAVADFAMRYADQTERDHAALERAVASGRVAAETGV